MKLSVDRPAADLLRRVKLEMSEIRGHQATNTEVVTELAGDWLAQLYRARDAERAITTVQVAGGQL